MAVRTMNALEDEGIHTVQDLLNCTPEALRSIPCFGPKTLEEVYRKLEGVGFYRRPDRQVESLESLEGVLA
jgi:DNA-directed RNA polymerase alpha subunit